MPSVGRKLPTPQCVEAVRNGELLPDALIVLLRNVDFRAPIGAVCL